MIDEVPFSKAALEEYTKRVGKRMETIYHYVLEYKKLRKRFDLAQKRLNKQGQSSRPGFSSHRVETGEYQ